MPYLDELREKLKLEYGDPITEEWYADLVEYLEFIEKDGVVDYSGYVHGDLIPEKDALFNLGVANLRFKQVYSVYGYFSYMNASTIVLHNLLGDVGDFEEISFSSLVPVKTISSDYMANYGEILLVDASSQGVTVTLPAPKSGGWVAVKKIDSSSNVVTVDGAGATIDGSETLSVDIQYRSYILVSDGSNWFILAKKD